MSQIHVAYDGKNQDLEFDEVFPVERRAGLGLSEGVISSSTVTPDQVKQAVAQFYDVGIAQFNDYYVEINPNGNITVRPDATFGGE
jgi:hypothetical protein